MSNYTYVLVILDHEILGNCVLSASSDRKDVENFKEKYLKEHPETLWRLEVYSSGLLVGIVSQTNIRVSDV